MNLSKYIDFTVLNPTAECAILEKALKYSHNFQVASFCTAPSMIDFCIEYISRYNFNIKLCTVVGFPLGYNTYSVKLKEVEEMINKGVEEIDFVLNRFYLTNKNWKNIEEETYNIIKICRENKVISKWIVESSSIHISQLIDLCKLANDLKPNFMKTSTGFEGKADIKSIEIMKSNLLNEIKIKASGGIKTKEEAKRYILAGADRIGTSTQFL